MKSILQKDTTKCFICGKNCNYDSLDKHHVFEGPYRSKSEKYGLFVFIHHNECHIFGKNAVHVNAEIAHKLKKYAQIIAMKVYGWSVEEFIEKFGRSHI